MSASRATVTILALLFAATSVVTNPPAALAQQTSGTGECSFERDSTVDVLLLLDQSRSLRGTDRNDRRVEGAKVAVNAFASLAERGASVRILVAGFGTNFEPMTWTKLTEATTGGVLEDVEGFATRDADWNTDYTEALHGAVREFETSKASCKILYWFTDGVHDIDAGSPELVEGLDRSYPADDPETATLQNFAEVEALVQPLVCGPRGYADRLGDLGVRTEIRLLGTGIVDDDLSRQVLEGMGGDPSHDCGPGNGNLATAQTADELPFGLACSSQFGLREILRAESVGGPLSINDQVIRSLRIPVSLTTAILVFATALEDSPVDYERPFLGSTLLSRDSGLYEISVPLTGEAFSLDLTNVEDACAFVTTVSPTVEVRRTTPTLYQGEEGQFAVVISGPFGEITGADLGDFVVESSDGEVGQTGERKVIQIDEMPAVTDLELTVTASVESLSATAVSTFRVNPPSVAPRILGAPQPIEGEGMGPFTRELQIDPKDGGEFCLVDSTVEMTDADGSQVEVTATLDGEFCVEVPPGGIQVVDLTIETSRQAAAAGMLLFRTESTPATGPQTPDESVIELELRVLPIVNTGVLIVIAVGILLVLVALLWAVLYGVNRLVARIPDVRRNKVRFGEFRAQLTSGGFGSYGLELLDTPKDNDLRVPRADSSQLKAGRLTVRRRVPVRPWVAPYAEMTLDTDFIAARMGTGASQNSTVERRVLRSRSRAIVEPVVMVGISEQQVERANGSPQPVHGVVLFDSRSAKGQDAGAVVAELIRNSLVDIAARLPALEQLREKG